MAERGARPLQEPALALGPAQRVGADDAHAVCVHRAQALPEALQAAQRTFLGFIVQQPVCAQPGAESHHLPQPVHDDQLAMRAARDDHVETVGS